MREKNLIMQSGLLHERTFLCILLHWSGEQQTYERGATDFPDPSVC